MEKLINYIILAVLIGLGVLLYVKRDVVMSYFQSEQSPMEHLQEAGQRVKQQVQDMLPEQEVETEEVDVEVE